MRYLYCNPDDDGTRATTLGCGWMPDVPAEFTSIATAPCVILAGAGQQVVLDDDGTLTADQVQQAAAPLEAAENTPTDTPTTQPVTVDPDALTAVLTQLDSTTTIKGAVAAVKALVNAISP